MNNSGHSYRCSHLDKGSNYQEKFSNNPRRFLTWKLEKRILDTVFARYLSGRPVDYLDFACGSGRILKHLEDRVRTATGVDVSATMLDVAREKTWRSRLYQGDITRDSTLGNATFDLITAFRFFPNAEQQLRKDALHALVRHLRENGVLVLNNHRSTGFSRNRIARFITAGKRGNQGMSPREVRELVEGAGLEILAIFHTEVLPETEEQLFRPRWLIELAESVCQKLPLASIAHDVIYVCRRPSSANISCNAA